MSLSDIVACPTCAKPVKRRGLPAHRRFLHGASPVRGEAARTPREAQGGIVTTDIGERMARLEAAVNEVVRYVRETLRPAATRDPLRPATTRDALPQRPPGPPQAPVASPPVPLPPIVVRIPRARL